MPAGIDRLAGYRDAIGEAGLDADPQLEATGDFTQASGVEAMTRLLALRPDIDAVFAASDLMAAGALSVLAASGRRVPRRRRHRRLRRLAGRDIHQSATDQRPSAHRGDGSRSRPPARGSGRRHGPGHTARDPGHRPGEARLERREALALSRPATGGIGPPWVDAPTIDLNARWRSIRSRRGGVEQTMNARRSVPKALIGLVGVVAIIASACGSSTTSTRAERGRQRSAVRGRRHRRRRRRRLSTSPPRPSRPVPARTVAPSFAGSSASAPAPSLPRSGRSRRSSRRTTRRRRTSTSSTRSSTTPRRRTSSRPRSPRATLRTSSARSASRA